MATINGQKKQQTAKTNNSAAGYTYTPGGSSGTGGNSLTNAVKTATSTMKTSGGTSKTDNVSSGAVQANGPAASGGKTSGGGTSPGQTGYSASAAASANTGTAATSATSASGTNLTGFTLGDSGLFTDVNGKQYNVHDYTRQPDGTIRNDRTGELINYQGQSLGRTASGYDYSDKDYAYSAYGPSGEELTLDSQEERDFLDNAPAGSQKVINGRTYTKNSDGGVTITRADGMEYRTRVSDTKGQFSGVDYGDGTGLKPEDWSAIFAAVQSGDLSGLTSEQRKQAEYHLGISSDTPASGQSGAGVAGQAGQMPEGWKEIAYDANGNPYEMSTGKAYDFLYNAAPGATMTGGDGSVWTKNADGTVTISKNGNDAVWTPGGTKKTGQDMSGMTEAQKRAAAQLSAYDSAYLAPEDQAAIAALKQAYQNAKDKGDKAGMQNANDQANAIRARYGYSGGGDGATLTILNQSAKTLNNIDLGSYQSALNSLTYAPVGQSKDWSIGMTAYDPAQAQMEYTPLASQYQGQTMGQATLPTYQSAYDGLTAPALSAQEGTMGSIQLGDYSSALNGLQYQPLAGNGAGTIGNIDLGTYNSVLNGIQYTPVAGNQAGTLGNINLGNYASALNGLQYTPQAAVPEAELAQTILPAYQAAYGNIQTPTLTGQQAQRMDNAALNSYQAQTDAVNQVYAAQQEAALAALKTAYENSKAETERGMSKIDAEYQRQRNAAAVENERARQLYNEQAAASGLNAGNRSQAALAFSNQLQNSLGQLGTAQANAIADAQFELNRLYSDYQNQISQAIAQNNYEKAAALLEEYRTAQQSKVDTAYQQAGLNLQTADYNRQVGNDATNALQQEFQNRLAVAQGQQADQQAAANLAAQQAALNLQTAQYNREGRQLERDAAQQNWQNQLTLAQLQDAAQQDAWNRAYQQAGLNLQVADYNRQSNELNRQAAQQDWQNQLALAQLQDTAQQNAWNQAYQQAGLNLQVADYNRQSNELNRQAQQQDWQNQLALAQMQDAAQQDAWNRALQQATLDMQVADYNREGRNINTQNQQQAFQNQLTLANARDAANQAAFNQAYQQAGLNLDTANYNRAVNDSYLNALQQDFANQLTLNQNQRDAQSQAYNQAYQAAQIGLQSQSQQNDLLQQNWQNRLALAQAQDAAQQAALDQAYRQAGLDLQVADYNRQAELDLLNQQQRQFENQRTLRNEQLQNDEFAWQQAQAEQNRQDQLAQIEREKEQQNWQNQLALAELGAQYGDMSRLSDYGYTPEQLQQMYKFAQMDQLGKILW